MHVVWEFRGTQLRRWGGKGGPLMSLIQNGNLSSSHRKGSFVVVSYEMVACPFLQGDAGDAMRTYILGYDGESFDIRDVKFKGSILALPTTCYLWKPKSLAEVTAESIALIPLIKPPIGG
jgi:glutamine synthetase type III